MAGPLKKKGVGKGRPFRKKMIFFTYFLILLPFKNKKYFFTLENLSKYGHITSIVCQ